MRITGRQWMAAAVVGLLLGTFGGTGTLRRDQFSASLIPDFQSKQKSPYRRPVLLGRLEDRHITESSGIAASRANPGMLWTHNDSGHGPFIYCVTLAAGACGVWEVQGAKAIDWEDISVGPGPKENVSYIYLGDIGDNARNKQKITVYRVPEPEVTRESAGTTSETASLTDVTETIELAYPDGAHDAESLMIHPTTGDLYVLTKGDFDGSTIFKALAPLSTNAVIELKRVGKITLESGLTSSITAASISPDGTRAVVATYIEALEFVLPADASFDEIFSVDPVHIRVGRRLQGEAITYRLDGKALLTTSEMVPAPLFETVQRGYPSSKKKR